MVSEYNANSQLIHYSLNPCVHVWVILHRGGQQLCNVAFVLCSNQYDFEGH